MKVNLVVDNAQTVYYNSYMDKETKQLNTFLVAVAVIGIVTPFMVSNYDRQIEAIQIDVGKLEVSQKVYRAIYATALSCNIENEIRTALDDERITYDEAEVMGKICTAEALDEADQPFQRGMLKEELNYSRNGGLSM